MVVVGIRKDRTKVEQKSIESYIERAINVMQGFMARAVQVDSLWAGIDPPQMVVSEAACLLIGHDEWQTLLIVCSDINGTSPECDLYAVYTGQLIDTHTP